MKKKGDTLEIFIEHLLKDLGKKKVKRNRTYKKRGFRAQVDITYGLFRPSFVECKHYSAHVPYEEFMKFVGVCNRFKPKERVMITTSDFEGRCYHDAHTYKVRLINGHQLRQLYRRSRFLIPRKHKKSTLSRIVSERGKYPYKPSLKRKTIDFSKYGLIFATGVFAYEHRDKWLPYLEQLKDLF